MKKTLVFAVLLTLASELSGQAVVWPGFFHNDFAKSKIEFAMLSISHDFGFGLKALASDQINVHRRLSKESMAVFSINRRGDQNLSTTAFSGSWLHQKGFSLISLEAQVSLDNFREERESQLLLSSRGDFELFPKLHLILDLSWRSSPGLFAVGAAIKYQVLDKLVGVLSYADHELFKKLQLDLEFELIKGLYLSATQEILSQSWTVGLLIPIKHNLNVIFQYAGATQLGARQLVGLNFAF